MTRARFAIQVSRGSCAFAIFERVEGLNYQHLYYFWLVVREGGVARAADKLKLSHPTISTQVKQLERALGEKLLVKQGRRLVPTEVGRIAYRYSDEIFGLGRDLLDTIKGRPGVGPLRLVVGISQSMPKLVARRLLAPARSLPNLPHVRLVCLEDSSERLLTELGAMNIDLLLSDAPVPPSSPVRAFNHLLGECGVTICATKELARRHRKNFPQSLSGAPMLLPIEGSNLRRALDQFFDENGIRPRLEGEFEDSALLKVFGQDGVGLFPVPSAVLKDVTKQYEVEIVGHLPQVRERFYAISVERKLKNPAVLAICEAARTRMFKDGD
ncbi:MAG: LysR family transcriptional regulator [Planctomycetota bacterium]|nr:LysR family transcriptional regulator [Planctomycetota bacterium]